jgi:hypothetical protein
MIVSSRSNKLLQQAMRGPQSNDSKDQRRCRIKRKQLVESGTDIIHHSLAIRFFWSESISDLLFVDLEMAPTVYTQDDKWATATIKKNAQRKRLSKSKK